MNERTNDKTEKNQDGRTDGRTDKQIDSDRQTDRQTDFKARLYLSLFLWSHHGMVNLEKLFDLQQYVAGPLQCATLLSLHHRDNMSLPVH